MRPRFFTGQADTACPDSSLEINVYEGYQRSAIGNRPHRLLNRSRRKRLLPKLPAES